MQVEGQVAADRLRKRQCPFCTSTDIKINFFAGTGTCRNCNSTMSQTKAQAIMKEYPPTE